MINSGKYIESVRKWLVEQGRYKDTDELALDILKGNIDLHNKIMKQLSSDITYTDQYGITKPSPFIQLKNQVESKIHDAEMTLGLNPKARKSLELDTSEYHDDIDDILSGAV